ncbi:MAG: formimidoylglutamase [Deltaproteobacteria bacterium]|nr:formimidoylglutamase [Deltaproteobacteria bacterium]
MTKKINEHWLSGRPNGQNSPHAVELIGAADDRGVLNVGGRLGASHGPQAIRSMLSQFMLGLDGAVGRVALYKGIDTSPGETIEEGHTALRRAVATSIKAGGTPIVLGGGHDYGYPHVAGAFDALGEKVALINVDAHLDLRPPGPQGITSGSPFFLALEAGMLKGSNFIEFGIQEHCNDGEFYKYALKKGVEVVMLEKARSAKGAARNLQLLLDKYSKRDFKVVVSFDLDAVQMAFAPGVSAPQTDGFTPAEFLAMAQLCGENPCVATIGFFELAPALDEGQRTIRLAATSIHRFLSGFSLRGEKRSPRRTAVGRLLRRR